MKFLLIAGLSVFAMGAFAGESLKDMKMKANDQITEKISSLESAKGCINGAQTKEAFKACKYDMSQKMDVQKEEAKEDIDESLEDMKEKTE